MTVPSLKEIEEAITLISEYRDRLRGEIVKTSQKLQIPKKKIDIALKNNKELTKLDRTLSRLKLELVRIKNNKSIQEST